MYKKNNKKNSPNSQNKENKIEIKGTVVEDLQQTNYLVEIDLGDELKHRLSAYPSGRMRKYYRRPILVGDSVIVEIDVPYIDNGRIIRRIVNKTYTSRSSYKK